MRKWAWNFNEGGEHFAWLISWNRYMPGLYLDVAVEDVGAITFWSRARKTRKLKFWNADREEVGRE